MQIYTNGAFLESKEVIIDGKKQWRWVVELFEGADSFCDGEMFNPPAYANTKEELEFNTCSDKEDDTD